MIDKHCRADFSADISDIADFPLAESEVAIAIKAMASTHPGLLFLG